MGGSLLPPDLRRNLEAKGESAPAPHRGIGGAARENAAEAAARAQAFGDASPATRADTPPAAEVETSVQLDRCPGCQRPVENEWNFCGKCGRDLGADRDPVEWLGISPFTAEDVETYLFKGFIVRDIVVLGKHRIQVKSSQPKDLKEVDHHFMVGEYKDKPLSQDLYKQLHTMASVAASIFSLDGKALGANLAEKAAWLEERGSAFVDMVTYRVAIYNRAWTRYLEEQNRLLGS